MYHMYTLPNTAQGNFPIFFQYNMRFYFVFVDLEKAFDRVSREVTMGSKEGRSGGMVGECSHGNV